MMEATVLSPSSGSWMEYLESIEHDIYHLPGYVMLEAQRLGGEPLGVLVKDGDRSVFLPLVLRPLPGGIAGTDVVSPYGYSGPLLSSRGLEDDSFVRSAGRAIGEVLSDKQCCAAFIRCHPLLPMAENLFEDIGRLRPLGPTVWIDLRMAQEQRWDLMTTNSRSSIRRTRREGYVASIDEEWDLLDRFVSLYRETMDRVGAGDSYYFDLRYFRGLKQELREHAHLMIVSHRDEVVAAGVFTEVCGMVQYHLSGSKRTRGKLSPNRLMVEYATTWAEERGNRVLHLGGGVGAASDSLLRFKAGFSPRRGSFSVWEIVTDQELFDRASSILCVDHGSDTQTSTLFFPPYRRP